MPESVTGIELVAFGLAVVAGLGFVGVLFAVFLADERPRNGQPIQGAGSQPRTEEPESQPSARRRSGDPQGAEFSGE
jgi:hypothetical protein